MFSPSSLVSEQEFYHSRRAEQEREMALHAGTPQARACHARLACHHEEAAYDMRLRLASRPSILRR